MRVREWYSWHFPELQKIVNEYEQRKGAAHSRRGGGQTRHVRTCPLAATACAAVSWVSVR